MCFMICEHDSLLECLLVDGMRMPYSGARAVGDPIPIQMRRLQEQPAYQDDGIDVCGVIERTTRTCDVGDHDGCVVCR